MDANCIAQATAHQTRRHRPAPPVLFHENIPSELAKLSRWVVWRFEWDSDTGKWDKPPTNPHDPGRHAKPDDPTTWGTFDAAIACYSRDSFDGVGFVAGNGVLCVDIDDCVDPATGDVAPWAQEIIAAADTYAERSPSGRGVRLFAIGDEPQIENQCGRKWYINARGLGADKTPQVEIYRERKYFTVTGDHIEGNPNKVEPWKTATIDVILRHAKQKNSSRRNGAKADPHNGNSANVNGINLSVSPTPAEVIAKARVARNGEKFAALFDHARGGGDHSADDLALCSILAFWCGPHPTLIDEVFRMSALMRDK